LVFFSILAIRPRVAGVHILSLNHGRKPISTSFQTDSNANDGSRPLIFLPSVATARHCPRHSREYIRRPSVLILAPLQLRSDLASDVCSQVRRGGERRSAFSRRATCYGCFVNSVQDATRPERAAWR
jgi:hypothetical protein